MPQRARSCSSSSFEIALTSTAGTAASAAARSTPKPSIPSTNGPSETASRAPPTAADVWIGSAIDPGTASWAAPTRWSSPRRARSAATRRRGRSRRPRCRRRGCPMRFRGPASPTWSTAANGLSASALAVDAAASTGPTPQTSPSCPQSSRSVAATMRMWGTGPGRVGAAGILRGRRRRHSTARPIGPLRDRHRLRRRAAATGRTHLEPSTRPRSSAAAPHVRRRRARSRRPEARAGAASPHVRRRPGSRRLLGRRAPTRPSRPPEFGPSRRRDRRADGDRDRQ